MQLESSERVIQFKRRERKGPQDEEDITLAELQRHIRDKSIRDDRQCEDAKDHTMESGSDETLESELGQIELDYYVIIVIIVI